MNKISEAWNAIDAALLAHKVAIGITSVEKAETSTVQVAKPPAVLTWIDFGTATTTAQGKIFSMPIEVFVFCIALPKKTPADAIEAAMDIAVNVLNTLSGMDICGADLLPMENPIDIAEKSSTKAVVAAMFNLKVRL